MKKTDNILAAIDENDIDYLSNVEFDVDCRIAESDNDTFFLYAISIPNFMYLDFFLEKNPDLNAVNDFGENILHCAVYSGSMERLKEMFCKLPISETLINSQKEFNEYIGKKVNSVANLFGTRVIRNETVNDDEYNYIRPYKKTITPFNAEVSASVFASAENNPMEYIVKHFYPNKSDYKEQIDKLYNMVEELETIKEAKQII